MLGTKFIQRTRHIAQVEAQKIDDGAQVEKSEKATAALKSVKKKTTKKKSAKK